MRPTLPPTRLGENPCAHTAPTTAGMPPPRGTHCVIQAGSYAPPYGRRLSPAPPLSPPCCSTYPPLPRSSSERAPDTNEVFNSNLRDVLSAQTLPPPRDLAPPPSPRPPPAPSSSALLLSAPFMPPLGTYMPTPRDCSSQTRPPRAPR
uniref:Uncharacterized protein n=1 Tax=Knipowitschia caucasica TaxID=637954 RepID=A0AAV2JLX7_KNICA